jgi:hypothetical protein
LAQNNIVSGIFASNLLRLKNHQLFRELLQFPGGIVNISVLTREEKEAHGKCAKKSYMPLRLQRSDCEEQ